MTTSTTGNADTIIALASGQGRAGVAVVRVSGSRARDVLTGMTPDLPEPRRATVRMLSHQSAVLDEALVLWMPGPTSYTGEDVAELHVHGGSAIVSAVISAALASQACRIAEPGEFTRRAFLNGRLDLTRAEAIGDLIDAETEGQRRQAQRLYAGEAQAQFHLWREELMTAMAALEAAIDFPDEADVPTNIADSALAPLIRLEAELARALAQSGRLEAVREGFRIAILGKPNAGKSSLLNRLARREAAIVSPIAGTTRDVVEVRIVLAGFPVWVADTAGLREAADAIEAEGVRRALARAEEADLRLWVIDAGDVSRETSAAVGGQVGGQSVSRETLPGAKPGDLVLLNKADLTAGTGPSVSRETSAEGLETIAVSALTGDGLESVESRLAAIVAERLAGDEPPLVTRARHRQLVLEALDHLRRALQAAQTGIGAELVSEDLRLTARALGRVTGEVDVEDLLDRIFAGFCIGK